VDLASSTLKDLTPTLKTESLDNIAWSPDSRQLIFTAGTLSENSLYMINRDGSGSKQLTRDRSTFISAPTW